MSDNKLSPFAFIKSINEGTRTPNLLKDSKCAIDADPLSPDDKAKQYNAFIVNRGLALFQDTVLFANEMNINSHVPNKMQYMFLKSAIRPKKRFTKWPKKGKAEEKVKVIMKYYNYSRAKAESVVDLVSDENINTILDRMNTGGMKNE